MRALAALAVLVPVAVLVWVLTRGPWPESDAQTTARMAADSLVRAALPDAALEGPAPLVVTGATRRGRLAWAAVEAPAGPPGPAGARAAATWRTSVWHRRRGEWTELVSRVAPAPGASELREGAAAGRFGTPAATGVATGRAAERLAGRFRRALDRYGRMRLDRQAVAVGPASGEVAFGDSAAGALIADWRRRLGVPRLIEDRLHARVAARGGVGWVTADLEVSPPDWGGVTLPLRCTAVYRERGESNWGLVLVHLAVTPREAAAAR